MTYAPTPNDFDALVALSRDREIDPLSVALLLFEESAFDPGRINVGSGDAGLNQMDPPNLEAAGLTRAEWVAMSAAEQLPHVFAFWDSLARRFAGGAFPSSGAALLALNFLPGRYRERGAATHPDAPLTRKGDVDGHRKTGAPYSYYDDNDTLDPRRTGAISVETIEARLADVAKQGGGRWAMISAGIRDAIARGAPPGPPAPPPAPPSPPAPPPTPASSGAKAIAVVGVGAFLLALASKGRAMLAAALALVAQHGGGC